MSDPVEFPGGESAGISEADQRDIRDEIERVAAENRIQISLNRQSGGAFASGRWYSCSLLPFSE